MGGSAAAELASVDVADVEVPAVVAALDVASGDGVSSLPAATSWMVVDSGWLLEAALITATLATDPAMRMPPAATTVAMMLDRCMGPAPDVWWWCGWVVRFGDFTVDRNAQRAHQPEVKPR